MKTLIYYATRYGTTGCVAEWVAEAFIAQTTTVKEGLEKESIEVLKRREKQRVVDLKVLKRREKQRVVDLKVLKRRKKKWLLDLKVLKRREKQWVVDLKVLKRREKQGVVDLKVLKRREKKWVVDLKVLKRREKQRVVDPKVLKRRKKKWVVDLKVLKIREKERLAGIEVYCLKEGKLLLEVEIRNVRDGWRMARIPHCERVQRVVLGVPVYMGKPLRAMQLFCEVNKERLTDTTGPNVYLFAMGVETLPARQEEALSLAFSEDVYKSARKKEYVVGRLGWNHMGCLHKEIAQQTTGLYGPRCGLDQQSLASFVKKILKDKERVEHYYRVGVNESVDRVVAESIYDLEQARLVMEVAPKKTFPKRYKDNENPYAL